MVFAHRDTGILASGIRDGEMRRLRALAAGAMVIASLAVGFLMGRASVWLVPFDAPPTAQDGADFSKADSGEAAQTPPETATAAAPAEQPADPPQPASATASVQPATPAAEGRLGTPAQSHEPAKPVVPSDWQPPAAQSAAAGTGGADTGGVQGPGVRIINREVRPSAPAGDDAGDAALEDAEPVYDRESLAACERRYSSFRRSDGTYQPYGGGERRRCPMLR